MPAPMTATEMGLVRVIVGSCEVGGWSDLVVRLDERLGGGAEAAELVELEILVLDVHGHVGVDVAERCEEACPPVDVVPTSDRHEVPRGVLGPAGERVAAAEAERAGLTQRAPGERVVDVA